MKGVINMKYKKTIILIVIALICLCMLPSTASAANLLRYNVTTDVTTGGTVYYNYGENGTFFLNKDWKSYSRKCKVGSDTSKFTKLLNRGFIVVPNSGYYFSGFYNKKGTKLYLDQTEMDVLRVSVNGVYFYDYYPSHDNPGYSRYTETGYQTLVKSYLKGIYGTSRYKVMDTITLYEIPKKDGTYSARFQKKKEPKINFPKAITKTYGTNGFKAVSSLPDNLSYSFKTSNSSVLTVNKKTGFITIKGPGSAKVTCSIGETDKTLPATYSFKVVVKPSVPKKLYGKMQKKKTVSVSWQGNSKNSGYEIQVSNNKSFSTVLAKKTVTSGKAKATTVKLKTDLFNNYVRIRAYKKSNGEKIYSSYVTVKITK